MAPVAFPVGIVPTAHLAWLPARVARVHVGVAAFRVGVCGGCVLCFDIGGIAGRQGEGEDTRA